MEAPEKVWINKDHAVYFQPPKSGEYLEYTRTDAFIEKACEWLKSYRQDTNDGTGYIAGIMNDKTIEDFRKAMEE